MLEICEKSDMPEYGLYELIPKIVLILMLSHPISGRLCDASLALYLADRISLKLNWNRTWVAVHFLKLLNFEKKIWKFENSNLEMEVLTNRLGKIVHFLNTFMCRGQINSEFLWCANVKFPWISYLTLLICDFITIHNREWGCYRYFGQF